MNCWIKKAPIGAVLGAALMLSQTPALGAEVTFPNFDYGRPAPKQFWDEMVVEFERRNPGDTVQVTGVPFGGFFDKQFSEVSIGRPTDVLTLFDVHIRQYINDGLLEPLDGYFEAAGVPLDELVPVARNLATKDGKIYAVPIAVNARAMLVNERLLEEKNIAIPTNVDEFYEAIKALRDEDKQQFGFATYSTPQSADLMHIELSTVIMGFGARYFRDGKPTANEDAMVDALTFYKKIYDEGLIPRGVEHSEYRSMFINGKVGMYSVGTFLVPQVKEVPETYDNLKTILLPFPDGGKSFTLTVFLAVPKAAKNKELAAKFIVQTLEDEWGTKYATSADQNPGRVGLIPQSHFDDNPWFEAFVRAAEISDSYAHEGFEQFSPEINQIIKDQVENMVFNNTDPQVTADALQAELEAFAQSKSQ